MCNNATGALATLSKGSSALPKLQLMAMEFSVLSCDAGVETVFLHAPGVDLISEEIDAASRDSVQGLFMTLSTHSATSPADRPMWQIADSGCQLSITNVSTHLVDSTPVKTVVQTAKSRATMISECKGIQQLPVHNENNQIVNLTVPDSLYLPECLQPLLSINNLVSNGHTVLFSNSFWNQ